MRAYIGTSGYSYAGWKGPFYPREFTSEEMLPFYAARFSTVEINNTFYHMPSRPVLQHWAAQVPPGFVFALKASQRVTHRQRLSNVGELVGYLVAASAELGDRLGPTLFQLPPNMKVNVERLTAFLALLPHGWRAAMEFRHPSWRDDAVHDVLRAHDVALCAADTDDEEGVIVPTASWGYMRLRRAEYDESSIARWADRIREQSWSDVFVYVKHEDAGVGPRYAATLESMLGSSAVRARGDAADAPPPAQPQADGADTPAPAPPASPRAEPPAVAPATPAPIGPRRSRKPSRT